MRGRLLQAEDGFSLVEVLITIVIVGVTFAALLGGLITTITVSSLHRKQATADSVARSAAEWIKDGVQTPYATSCAGVGMYSVSGLPKPAGYSVAIQSVEYWDGAGAVAGTPYALNSGIGGHLGPACPAGGDKGLQRITIVVTSSDPQISETVQVIKRTL
jgi:prepilin-type N-terminal cleavage/methylation domain-containing protein